MIWILALLLFMLLLGLAVAAFFGAGAAAGG
jgi:hypothetical protein